VDESSRRAVETAERYADGLATKEDLRAVRDPAFTATMRHMAASVPRADGSIHGDDYPQISTADAAWSTTFPRAKDLAQAARCVRYIGSLKDWPWQSDLLRCVFGNLFRATVFDPAWRTPTVITIAQAIYTERRFADLPILADALEEAGCTIAAILDHCRSGGEHARGCWPVDLVSGKQ
jgi:hypothetical protein